MLDYANSCIRQRRWITHSGTFMSNRASDIENRWFSTHILGGIAGIVFNREPDRPPLLQFKIISMSVNRQVVITTIMHNASRVGSAREAKNKITLADRWTPIDALRCFLLRVFRLFSFFYSPFFFCLGSFYFPRCHLYWLVFSVSNVISIKLEGSKDHYNWACTG